MASDAPSLARWWSKLCAGEIVSQRSLTEMTTFREGYGLGLSDDTEPYGTPVVGHGGIQFAQPTPKLAIQQNFRPAT